MYKLLLFLLIVFSACDNTSISKTKTDIVSNIQYTKDPKTGLCFAVVGSWTYSTYQVVSITCVPCDSVYRKEYYHENN